MLRLGRVKFFGLLYFDARFSGFRQIVNDFLHSCVVVLPTLQVSVHAMNECSRQCSFHFSRRDIFPASVVNAQIMMKLFDPELSFYELLWSHFAVLDVVCKCFLCDFTGI